MSQAVARRSNAVDLEAAWISWLAGRPPTTTRARMGDLRELGRWMAERTGRAALHDPRIAVEAVIALGPGRSRALISAWRAEQADRGLRDSSIARRISTICSFVAECRHHGLAWALVIERPRVAPYQARECPDWQRVEDVVAELERCCRWRELAAILLLCDVGLRRAEVCSLRVEDYDAAAPSVSVRRKGGVRVTRTISKRAAEAITASLGERETGPLLVSSTSAPLSPTTLADWTVRFDLGRPHALRRAGATELHRRGADVSTIRAHLGHASLQTTQVYVRELDDEPGRATRLLAGEHAG